MKKNSQIAKSSLNMDVVGKIGDLRKAQDWNPDCSHRAGLHPTVPEEDCFLIKLGLWSNTNEFVMG